MSYEFHGFACPDLGKELLKNAKGELPIDVWRHYVLQHSPRPRAGTLWEPPSIIGYCDEAYRSTLDPQKAVDEAWLLLSGLIMPTRPLSHEELAQGVWKAVLLLFSAHSSGRRRGQPSSMQRQAVRAWVIRKFNPHPTKPDESKVRWRELADKLFINEDKCPRKIRDEAGNIVCGASRHDTDSPCVKALITAVGNLESAMKRDGIPL
jgi:hypothetical protein